ncbi:GMC oxidoreductase [Ruegeria sp. 2205SS24-7]|uniref:GMC oxidoreductase n=1 Tax=Ruegeria discodermiae TaxID=3064389 RepID=UPI002740ECF1|nr:GMC oxidoreductase [Ruegeria sp. 2205SS24-7]MDP5216969.1 GMC oxidoreductase [Ruegeria sp. 2205SS24-7]
MSGKPEFDAVVIGTGFAGAVTAARLVQAGLNICVLERGRRYEANDFPKYPTENLFTDLSNDGEYSPPPDFSRWLWNADSGLYDFRNLGDVVSLQAAAYGGGSTIYANVHLRPAAEVFEAGWPDEYRIDRLKDYFDLAAYMLQAAPITKRLAKTAQLRRAASELSKKHNSLGSHPPSWFLVPLAVNFDNPKRNVWKRRQGACDMRAKCCLGCGASAKNSLDMNYLAIVEDATVNGKSLAAIKTLAEVKSIKRVKISKDAYYQVCYWDHLSNSGIRPSNQTEDTASANEGLLKSVTAQYVFLCAGSINTTELLMDNRKNLWPKDSGVALGSHYFPNADSLAAIFDCDEDHESDYGPIATSALLYDQPSEDATYSTLMEFSEGLTSQYAQHPPTAGDRIVGSKSRATAELAYPPLLDWGEWEHSSTSPARGELLLCNQASEFTDGEELLFRPPGRKNKIARATVRSTRKRPNDWMLVEDGGFPPDVRPLLGAFRSPLWLCRNRFSEHTSTDRIFKTLPRATRARHLHVQTLAEAVGGTQRNAVLSGNPLSKLLKNSRPETFRSFEYKDIKSGLTHQDIFERNLVELLPKWLTGAIEDRTQETFEHLTKHAEPMLGRLLDSVARTLSERVDTSAISSQLDLDETNDNDIEEQKIILVRGMLRLAVQLILNSEAGLARLATNALTSGTPKNLEELLNLAGDLVLWALAHRSVQGHTALILLMGRDLHRGKLRLNDDGRLIATLPGQHIVSARSAQERLLRTLAKDAWNGELRTNPVWSIFGQRVTVHSQGGCPMGSAIDNSVTDPSGQVHKCPGLYVMDAAAFPTSVGVNPSAAITAVAEYKVEKFIREVLKRDNWAAPDMIEAREWTSGKQHQLDPIGTRSNPTQFDIPGAIGLKFSETLVGFFSSDTDECSPVDWQQFQGFEEKIGEFDTAEKQGVESESTIDLVLDLSIANLNDLLVPARNSHPAKLRVKGTLSIPAWPNNKGSKGFVLDENSFVQLFLLPQGGSARTRYFRYQLRFQDGNTQYRLHGGKIIRDDPEFDVWSDTSTLHFDLMEYISGTEVLAARGIVRMPIENFLSEQLGSFKVTGTDDPVRQTWALAAFGRYFFGHLVDIYLPETNRVLDMAKQLVSRTHA